MACIKRGLGIIIYFVYFSICASSKVDSVVREINEDNWQEILTGEWMVEFYAPWCPACNALQPAWRDLSLKVAKIVPPVQTGAIDITLSPGLSGRFVVTALPTIFHVKNGEFRQYKGPRDTESMMSYVKNERWKQTEPIPGWKAPDSIQMSLVANFFKLSQALRTVHNTLMETYGLPTWGSYLIFAIVTIFVGALIGLILVCIIDLLYPPRKPIQKVTVSQSEADELAKGDQDTEKPDDPELINDDIVDDDDNGNDSDAEKNSQSDSTEDEQTGTGAAGDVDGKEQSGNEDEQKTGNAEVRKRRPRKAD